MMDSDSKKLLEAADYRSFLLQSELNDIKGSRSYRVSKKLVSLKNHIIKDPIGLSKKALRFALTHPQKLLHLRRKIEQSIATAQGIAVQIGEYQKWILLYEPNQDELNAQKIASLHFAKQPLVSILTPVFNPPIKVLEELIESILKQTYSNFELCLGDFGDNQDVQELINHYVKIDDRIKYYHFTENNGIAANSNTLLEMVKGEYIALLDHDDTLSPDALFENILLINQKPYDFIYSDKDKIDEAGNRFDPVFKADFSPETLLNVNYLTHLNVMRTDLVREIGGWDSSTDGAQDWDLFFRITSVAQHIGHIPKVLYHWRILPSSTAFSMETKPYAFVGQRNAIDNYLNSQNIPAKSYHKGNELFLCWDEKALDEIPLVFVTYNNSTDTLQLIRSIKEVRRNSTILVLIRKSLEDSVAIELIKNQRNVTVLQFGDLGCNTMLQKACKDSNITGSSRTVLFLSDALKLSSKTNWYQNLTGWLSINNVAATGGRVFDRHDLIASNGGFISESGNYLPLYKDLRKLSQVYTGNSEWVRNLNILSGNFAATALTELREYLSIAAPGLSYQETCDDYFLWLSNKKKLRLVFNPHAEACIYDAVEWDNQRTLINLPHGKELSLPYCDIYSNTNLDKSNPMRLLEQQPFLPENEPQGVRTVDRYVYDAMILSASNDISENEINISAKNQLKGILVSPKTAAWILPSFDGVYAGLVNIFSFASFLANEHSILTTFYIFKGENDSTRERQQVIEKFPQLKSAQFICISPDSIEKIGTHDLGFATQWGTTFSLAKAANIKRKCYFIQDNEVNFYPKGSLSAIVQLGYQFEFYAVAGTDGLLDMYKKQYGGKGTVLKSKLDLSTYLPRSDKHYLPQKPYKVFFYARPNMPRNAFELGIAGLKLLKQRFGNEIEIITAGAEWDEDLYSAQGMFTNLGKIAYEAVPKLYRSVDAGLMFMFSGHPGVTASELMASGCPVVVNEYDDVTWHELYQDEKTCLITLPTASEVARNIERCLTDLELRHTLVEQGLKKANSFYANYGESLENAWQAILKGE